MPSATLRTQGSVTRPTSQQDEEALRELLGPAADLPSPPSPDDRTDHDGPTGGIIPGTGRRSEDHEATPGQNREGSA
jgi:hypothetical protein